MYQAFIMRALLLSAMTVVTTQAIVIGDVVTTVRQQPVFFPSSDVNNRLFGFSVLQNGLILQNDETKATFDGLMPVRGYITLNGGTLILNRDLELKDPAFIGSGTIEANNYSINFNSSITSFDLSPLQKNFSIKLSDQDGVGSTVNSLDWSYDDAYLAVVVDGKSNNNELQIFKKFDNNLQLVASQDFAKRDVNAVRWHPSQLLLAIGQDGATDLELYKFDDQTKSLVRTSAVATGEVNAVAWHPSGNYLVVGKVSSNSLLLYSFSEGVLSTPITTALTGTTSVIKNGLSWSENGQCLAVGAGSNLYLYELNNQKLTLGAQTKVGSSITCVTYTPTNNTISLGCNNCGESFKLFNYDFQAKKLIELQKAWVGESKPVYAITWLDNNFVAYATAKDSQDHEIKIIRYDSTYNTGMIIAGHNVNATINALQWSHAGAYLTGGGDDKKVSLFKFTNAPITFKNARLVFNSDVNVNCELRIEGNCVINGGNNLIDLTKGSIKIAPGSSLVLQNADIKGIEDHTIQCENDNAQLVLNEINWIQNGQYVFDTGLLKIKNRVAFIGDNSVFSYESAQPIQLLTLAELAITDLVTFNYLPQAENALPIQYADTTARILLQGGVLRINKKLLAENSGKIVVQSGSYIITQDAQQVGARAVRHLLHSVNKNTINSGSGVLLLLKMLSKDSSVKLNPDTDLYLYDLIHDSDGSLQVTPRTTIINQFQDPKI